MTFHADTALAERLEGLAAAELRRFVAAAAEDDPFSAAETAEFAGGVAAFVGRDSLVNRAVGLGFERKVTRDDALGIVRFFSARHERATVAVCPLADGSVLEALSDAGFVADTFENVLALDLADDAKEGVPAASVLGLEIREAVTEEERSVWAYVAATGFSAPLDPLPQQLDLARIVVRRDGTRLFTGFIDGRPAATAEMIVSDGVGWLSADSTLPQYQGRGIQAALQRHRLGIARAEGCELAVTESHPGSSSQRNMERCGFRVVYTRVDLIGPQPEMMSR